MTEDKEEKLLLKICEQLDKITKTLNDLNKRVNRIEGKTNDIHEFTPFVRWLEGVGRQISKKCLWLRGIPDVPCLSESYSKVDSNDLDECGYITDVSDINVSNEKSDKFFGDL